MIYRAIIIFLGLSIITSCKNDENQKKELDNKTPKAEKNSTIPEFWNDPNIFEFGREIARTDFHPFESELKSISDHAANSKYHKTLNGFWRYQYFAGPDFVPAQIEKLESTNTWLEMSFPACIELKGYGKPIFKYFDLPFKGNYPFVPRDSNSVMVLKRNIDIPTDWKNRDIFALFEGISSAYFLYVNGQLAGYNEDSKAMSEFLLNPFLKEEGNQITLVLYRWSDASYFESYNKWHLTGINRDAYLISRPKFRIRDFYAKTDFKGNNASLDLDIHLKNSTGRKINNYKLEIKLFKDSNQLIFDKILPLNDLNSEETFRNTKAYFSNIQPWSDEIPKLYDLRIILTDSLGVCTEAIQYKIGFNSIQYQKGVLLVNEQKIKIKGVSCHEFHPLNGAILDVPWMENDADVLKLYNINAVRNNHYPFPISWYKIMQKFGLYILDESNLTASVFSKQNIPFPDDSICSAIYLQRVQNMFERNKNYCNIICWSLGYQLNQTPSITKAYEWIKSKDKKRPASWISLNQNFGDVTFNTGENLNIKKNKPVILYSMSANKGNGLGGFNECWDRVKKNENIAGGFIEDFTDQTFYMKNKSGKLFFAYGGSFGETQSDSFLCVSGIMTSNKTPKPSSKVVSTVFNWFETKVIDIEKGQFDIYNNHKFIKDTIFSYFWNVSENGEIIKEGKIDKFHLLPGDHKAINIDYGPFDRAPGKEYTVNITINKTSKFKGMFRFQLMAVDQFIFPRIKGPNLNLNNFDNLKINSDTKHHVIENNTYNIKIDRNNGNIVSIKMKDKEMLKSTIKPIFSRAPTDNDIFFGKRAELSSWWLLSDQITVTAENLERINDKVIQFSFASKINFKNDLGLKVKYLIYASGDIELNMDVIAINDSTNLPPRLGWIFDIPSSFGTARWYGRGPYDSYQDRKVGMLIGNFKSTVTEFNVPQVRPQEMANKSDVRWLNLSTFDGIQFLATGKSPIDVNALPFKYERLYGQFKYGTDLPIDPSNCIILGSSQWPLGDGLQNNSKFKSILNANVRIKFCEAKTTNAEDIYNFSLPD
ncbi:MAG: hypothetical protein IPF46_09180 [Saprospiraceae bacterium]|nr:hypothetical protein [Candidatus Vicinibacter affinis]